jgi:hypothetical protein
MFLVDTNVLSERRKGSKADPGIVNFLDRSENELFLPVQTVGELLSGVEKLRQRGDSAQVLQLEAWLHPMMDEFATRILPFDLLCAQTWGKLMGANDQNPIDKQIAAIALVYDLTVVTRNTSHFAGTGVRVLNPFLADSHPDLPTN